MNKNLKKVISAVAALAMTASTFVAFAANYPDVDASASYKTAVDELSALNIINGYEDGTFQPDKLVNRAEFAKMVITTLGKAELAQAEAAANTNTAFTDVKADHWAAGFVSAATANKIINGFDDGTFKPEANITYAQAMKMLVCAAGYEQWSADKGGWPTGYMYWGNQLDLGNGVKDVVQDTEITRAQCAQMIDNVLNAPVCVETGKMNWDMYGNQYAELEPKDGYGIDFQSILTKKHKAYKVKGMVTDTHQTGVNKKGEVTFTIMSARNWDNEEDQIKRTDDDVEITALIGNSDADKFMHKYVEAIIAKDDDEQYEIVSVSVTGQNTETAVEADQIDEDAEFDKAKLQVLKNGKASYHKIADNAKVYVNGVSVGDYDLTNYNEYIKDSVSGVTLIDVPSESNTADGKADYVMVEKYYTAVVDSVNAEDKSDIEIGFAAASADVDAPWSGIDLEDEDVVYTFTLDGEAFDVADLEQYDVLSIKCNPNYAFGLSNFYDVKVSKNNAVEGRVSSYDPEEGEYEINGTSYKDALNQLSGTKATGESFVVYLDVFGRIAYSEDLVSEKKIAILDSAYTSVSGDNVVAKLILTDGTSVEYTLRDTDSPIVEDDETTHLNNQVKAQKIVYGDTYNSTKVKEAIQDRVVVYSLNSSNELTIKEVLKSTNTTVGKSGLYKAAQSKIGSYTIDTETTSFIYANKNDSKDISALSVSTLVDGNKYDAYFYDRSTSNNVYRFVIVTTGAGQFTPYTSMAVVKKQMKTTDESGSTVDALSLLINGEPATVLVDDSVSVSFEEGDAIVYETNAEGYITKAELLLNMNLNTPTEGYASVYEEIYKRIVMGKEDVEALLNTEVMATMTDNGDDEAELHFGPIINNKGGITLGVVNEDGTTNVTEAETISYASDVKFYAINYNYTRGSRVVVADQSAVSTVTLTKSNYADDDQNEIDWSTLSAKTNPRFALVKTVEGDATDVYVIIPKSGTEVAKAE